ncbi:MAG: IS1182 family transposase [Candidatus Aminicenantes bacterium]|nr:IS1182 family transposase [Candidatus Aminicenantes bacterium]
MAYRYGNREQQELFPQTIEEYVAQDDPVRAYDAFIEALDFSKLELVLDENKAGNPGYNPKAMLKLFVYGPSYGVRSSRKLERANYHNLSFIWLMGGLKPDHKTIALFRKNNRHVLKNVLKQCAQMCIKLDLIAGNSLFVDGSKIRANASIKNTWTKEKCQEYLKKIDQRVEAILDECEAIDNEEQNQPSLVKLNKKIKDNQALKAKVQAIFTELKQEDKKSINTIDKECTRINSVQGSHAGYNVQTVVDEKHGFIVNADVVSENNDVNQFANQIEQANETLGKKCKTACADSGYANTEQLKQIDQQDIKVIVPSQRQASKKEPEEFDKEQFNYNPTKDCYICPQGHNLICEFSDGKTKRYKITQSSICIECNCFGKCTKSLKGRQINRLVDEEIRLRLEAQYLQPESQAIYKLRKQKVELPFGHIKRNLGVKDFLLRGIDGVKAELSALATCFNVTRMISIFGVTGLIKELILVK